MTRISLKKNFKSLLFLDHLTDFIENLHRSNTLECKKFDGSAFFNFCFFGYLCHLKVPKIEEIAIFSGFCAINSKKWKINKSAPIKFFALFRSTFLCKLSSKTVKWSRRSSNLKVIFFKILVKTLYFCPIFDLFSLRQSTFKRP